MKRNQRIRIDTQLQELYDRVPELDCKGLCHTSCGVIEASSRERDLMKERGYHLPMLADFVRMDAAGEVIECVALRPDKQCGVYDVRPMVCRLWGATESMPCPYGCQPVDGGPLLSEAEGFELLGDSLAVGGNPDGRREVINGAMLRIAAEAHPELIRTTLDRGKRADAARARKQLEQQ